MQNATIMKTTIQQLRNATAFRYVETVWLIMVFNAHFPSCLTHVFLVGFVMPGVVGPSRKTCVTYS